MFWKELSAQKRQGSQPDFINYRRRTAIIDRLTVLNDGFRITIKRHFPVAVGDQEDSLFCRHIWCFRMPNFFYGRAAP